MCMLWLVGRETCFFADGFVKLEDVILWKDQVCEV